MLCLLCMSYAWFVHCISDFDEFKIRKTLARDQPDVDIRLFSMDSMSSAGENSWGTHQSYWTRDITGRMARLSNPINHFSVLTPAPCHCRGGCTDRTTATARTINPQCVVATNAGFFNTKTNQCLGHVISQGKVHQLTNVTNAAFGVTSDGYFVVGYLNASTIKSRKIKELVSGVIWLVRNGTTNVKASLQREHMQTQQTGSEFTQIVSARTAIGHDQEGRLLLMTINGQSYRKGVNLYHMADLMVEMGAINAINLDGGGSATFSINGTLSNNPSDHCKRDINDTLHESWERCERNITTIICLHNNIEEGWHCNADNCSVRGVYVCQNSTIMSEQYTPQTYFVSHGANITISYNKKQSICQCMCFERPSKKNIVFSYISLFLLIIGIILCIFIVQGCCSCLLWHYQKDPKTKILTSMRGIKDVEVTRFVKVEPNDF